LLQQALSDSERGLGKLKLKVDHGAIEYLAEKANGDARSALNALEMAALVGREEDGEIIVSI